jgi:type VI secretion system secreted protein VgrG
VSDDNKTTPPAAANGASPACGTTVPCPDKKCWPDDYDKEISVNTYGRYFKKYKADGTTEIPLPDSVPFKIYAPVKSGTDITVEVRFKVEKDSGVSDADVTSAKTKLETGVSTNWNNKFKLVANDPECPSKTFKIAFKPVWVDSGQHYTIKVHNTYPREGVTGVVMDVSKTTDAWTYAHEFGHCFGLPDEYSYSPTETQQVKYIKPDGTLDAAVSAPPSKSKTAADATIMSSVNCLTTLPRHAWDIAIEVQDLLTQKIGRTIKCSIQ